MGKGTGQTEGLFLVVLSSEAGPFTSHFLQQAKPMLVHSLRV